MSERVIPAIGPPPLDPLESQLSKLLRLLEGWTDDGGKHHPGVVERLESIEARQAAWAFWTRTAGVAAVVSAVAGVYEWAKAHIR